MRPDFIIIGAAKAGTTTLHEMLRLHPDLFMTTPKEPEFFARDDRYTAGPGAYAALFGDARPGQKRGEASTLYSLTQLFPRTVGRMRAHAPDVRLIYILREPVGRAYSYYAQIAKNYQKATRDWTVHRSFEECVFPEDHPGRSPRERMFAPFDGHLPDDPETFVGGSRYLRQIEAYQEHFPREQMLFLNFEAFMADRRAGLARVLRFLELDPDRIDPGAFDIATNVASDHFTRVARERGLAAARRRFGPLAAAGRLLPEQIRRRARRALGARFADAHREDATPPPMAQETRRRLRAEFHADRGRLEALTGLSLDHWERG